MLLKMKKSVHPAKYSISYDMSKNIPVGETNKCKGCLLKRDLVTCPKNKSCNNKKQNDPCVFSEDQISFNGKCNDCGKGQIFLPEKVCEPEISIDTLFTKSNGSCIYNFACI